MTAPQPPAAGERADLTQTLDQHRYLFTTTARNLTDEQARLTPTVSALSVGGLIKHVTATERAWAAFIVEGPSAFGVPDEASLARRAAQFVMGPNETLGGLLDDYARAAAATDELVATVDLDADQPLPTAPWFPPGARWTARRVLLHIIAETSQHAGHADIVRETIDGAKTMG